MYAITCVTGNKITTLIKSFSYGIAGSIKDINAISLIGMSLVTNDAASKRRAYMIAQYPVVCRIGTFDIYPIFHVSGNEITSKSDHELITKSSDSIIGSIQYMDSISCIGQDHIGPWVESYVVTFYDMILSFFAYDTYPIPLISSDKISFRKTKASYDIIRSINNVHARADLEGIINLGNVGDGVHIINVSD